MSAFKDFLAVVGWLKPEPKPAAIAISTPEPPTPEIVEPEPEKGMSKEELIRIHVGTLRRQFSAEAVHRVCMDGQDYRIVAVDTLYIYLLAIIHPGVQERQPPPITQKVTIEDFPFDHVWVDFTGPQDGTNEEIDAAYTFLLRVGTQQWVKVEAGGHAFVVDNNQTKYGASIPLIDVIAADGGSYTVAISDITSVFIPEIPALFGQNGKFTYQFSDLKVDFAWLLKKVDENKLKHTTLRNERYQKSVMGETPAFEVGDLLTHAQGKDAEILHFLENSTDPLVGARLEYSGGTFFNKMITVIEPYRPELYRVVKTLAIGDSEQHRLGHDLLLVNATPSSEPNVFSAPSEHYIKV